MEELLEHLGSGLGEIDEGDQGLAEIIRIVGVFDGRQDVENIGDQGEVLGLALLADVSEKGGKGFHGSQTNLRLWLARLRTRTRREVIPERRRP